MWTSVADRLFLRTSVAHRSVVSPFRTVGVVVVGRLGVVIVGAAPVGTRLVVAAQRGQAIRGGQVREWRATRSGHLPETPELWHSGVQSIRKRFLECGSRCLSVVQICGRWRCSRWSLGAWIRPTAQIRGGSVQPLEGRVIACLCQELQTNCRLTLPFGSAEGKKR